MKLETLMMEMPKEVDEFLWKVQEIDKDAVIVGDYLFYLDMDIQTRCVDIYTKEEGLVIEELVDNQNLEWKGERYHIIYKDILFRIHHSEEPREEIHYQDLTLRELMYDGVFVTASEDALNDSDDGLLKVGVTNNPLKTLVDLYELNDLGLLIDKERMERLFEIFNCHRYMAEDIRNEIKRVSSKNVRDHFMKWMNLNENENKRIVFDLSGEKPIAISLLKKEEGRIKRDLFDKLYDKNDFYERLETYSFNERPFKEEILKMEESIKTAFKKKILKWMYHYPLEAKHWKEELDEPYFCHLILPKIIEKVHSEKKELKEDTKEILNLIQNLEGLIDCSVNTKRKIQFKVTNKLDLYLDGLDLDDYVNNHYVLIETNDNMYSTKGIYNVKTGELTGFRRGGHVKKLYEKILREMFTKNKTLA